MSDNNFRIVILLKAGAVTKEKLLEFLNPLSWGEKFHESFLENFDSEKSYLDCIVSNVFDDSFLRNIPRKMKDINWVYYEWFTISCLRGDGFDRILVEFHKENLNPGRMEEDQKLEIYYDRAKKFIDFTRFIWNSVGNNGIYAIGDWELIWHKLSYFKIPVENAFFHFWLCILPEHSAVPEKYAASLGGNGVFGDYVSWYTVEKTNNGTLLVASPLPWSVIGESPSKVTWAELEEKMEETRKGD